jgi:hypothetical protein
MVRYGSVGFVLTDADADDVIIELISKLFKLFFLVFVSFMMDF